LYYVDKANKKDLLLHILKDTSIESVLVFTRTKHGADRIVKQLSKEKVIAQAIHGDKSQGARQNALSNFKSKKLRILVATDIAARGIDIDELSHVINYDLPNVPETYVHRIGRTGRAGLNGVAISFCDFDEKPLLADIERLIGKRLKEVEEHPYPLMNDFPAVKNTQPRREPVRTEVKQAAPQKTSNNTGITTQKISNNTDITTHKTSNNAGITPRKEKTLSRNHRAEDTSPKKKFRMTADGVLKEKRSKFSKWSPKKSK
jgi:ATP-dependent RNA helicase RhlE